MCQMVFVLKVGGHEDTSCGLSWSGAKGTSISEELAGSVFSLVNSTLKMGTAGSLKTLIPL
jgi:hypothetical protein